MIVLLSIPHRKIGRIASELDIVSIEKSSEQQVGLMSRSKKSNLYRLREGSELVHIAGPDRAAHQT